MENWFAFRAFNTQTIYGFGSEAQAETYCDHLNKGREINVYSAHAMDDADIAEKRLNDSDLGFNLDDELRGLDLA